MDSPQRQESGSLGKAWARWVHQWLPRRFKSELLEPLSEFLQTEAFSGILLVVAGLVAFGLANSPWAADATTFWRTHVRVEISDLILDKSLLQWLDDGLMAIFFLYVGLEIKREVLVGELSQVRQALLPICAAIGGMALPALIFFTTNLGRAGESGWAIPMATDIALSLGVLALLGDRVPLGLKVFLAALAIVDDLGAVLVIALFYGHGLNLLMLYGAGATLLALVALNASRVRSAPAYFFLGVLLWLFLERSGLHATIAGILLALCIPARVRLIPSQFTLKAKAAVQDFEEGATDAEASVMLSEHRQAAVTALEEACRSVQMPVQRLEHALQPWVTYGIVPLFVLANARVAINAALLDHFDARVGLGVLGGLVVGKPLGIFMFSYAAVKLKWAALPEGVDLRHILGAGLVGGIGLTMSLFITGLAFPGSFWRYETAKVTILIASVISGLVGMAYLAVIGRSIKATDPLTSGVTSFDGA